MLLRPSFSDYEFFCHHAGEPAPNGMDNDLLDLLQGLRDEIGVPIQVVSGYRCRYWNRRVGGERNSYHIKGMAADIRPVGMSYQQFYRRCLVWFSEGGVGHYPPNGSRQPWVHVDVGPKRRWEG